MSKIYKAYQIYENQLNAFTLEDRLDELQRNLEKSYDSVELVGFTNNSIAVFKVIER